MRQTERLYQIDRLLRGQGFATFGEIQQHLEVSRATVKRDLAFMRERLNVPIIFDRDVRGYRIDKQSIGPRHELPGLWFDDDELLGLLSIHRMLADLDVGGVLGRRLRPLIERLQSLLSESMYSKGGDQLVAAQFSDRIRIAHMHDRRVVPAHFARIARALLERQRVDLSNYSRVRDQVLPRLVSPQRLLHYRNAWYLDAWCHIRDDWRTFSLDAVREVRSSARPAFEPSADRWRERVRAGYGIFTGPVQGQARLQFNAISARWVRDEHWHRDQEITELADGGLILALPYADSTELEMDVLRHAEHVRVLGPPELINRVRRRLVLAGKQYESGSSL